MNKLVCVAGMTGSGKSVLSDFFVEKGFRFLRFGQVVLDEIIKNKLEPNEDNQKEVREGFRKKYGMEAIALLNLPIINKLLTKGNVVADGLYSWPEYKLLKEMFGRRIILIAIFTPPEVRYKRLADRHPGLKDKKLRNHHFSADDAKKRDYNEIENIEKGGPIAMADYTILNTGSLRDFRNEMESVYRKIIPQ